MLDMEMTALSAAKSCDRPAYTDFNTAVQKERELIDSTTNIVEHIKWLEQTMTYMVINATDPATDPSVLSVITAIANSKQELEGIVSIDDQLTSCLLNNN